MQEMANLSQQDYIKRIDELNNALLAAWGEDDRVKSLKIVIQVKIVFDRINYTFNIYLMIKIKVFKITC